MTESKRKKLTQERLKELLDYDLETGVLSWRKSGSGHPAGPAGGDDNGCGYLVCQVDGKLYLCHRLAWLYVYGYFPENDIDHINRDRADNRIENLREVSRQCNIRNSKQTSGTASGVKGISWDKQTAKWRATIAVNGKHHCLGRYKHKHNAGCARLAAEQCLDWSGCDSNSPAYQYVQKNIIGKRMQNDS